VALTTRTNSINPNVVIIDLEGRLDVHQSNDIEKAIDRLIENKDNINILINLEKVEYLSSSGLRIFIATKRKLKDKDGKMRLMNMNDAVRKIFKVVELIDLFDVYTDEDEAVKSF